MTNGVPRNELAIITKNAQNMPELLEGPGGNQLTNSSGPVLQDRQPICAHAMNAHFERGVREMTLSRVELEAHGGGRIEQGGELRGVVLEVVGENQYVINIYQGQCPAQRTEHQVHETLKLQGGVLQPEGNQFILIQSAMGQECSLPPVTFGNSQLVITTGGIKDGKDTCAMKSVEHGIGAGHRISLPSCGKI